MVRAAGLPASPEQAREAAASEAALAEQAWGLRRRFFLPVIAPGLLQGKSGAVVTPMLPIFVRVDLHGSVAAVGLIASAYPLAQFYSSALVGVLLKHMRYGTSSCLSLCVLIATALLSYFSQTVAVLFAIRIFGGVAMGAWDLSRKAYISAEVPNSMRGRIASTLAGMQKCALVVAALLSGLFAEHLQTRSIFLVQIAFTGTALALLVVHEARTSGRSGDSPAIEAARSPAACDTQSDSSARSRANMSLLMVLREHWADLLGAGGFCAMLTGCRNTWQIALPLQAHNIGLNKAGIGVAVAVVRAVEACVTFTAAGQIMDKHGRKAGTIPAVLLMALAFGLLPMAKTRITLLLAGLLYGLGNGLSGGIIVSFSTGLAPPHARTQFLGLWKTVTALGGFILPPLFGFVADRTKSLETATMMLAFVEVLSALWLAFLVREKAHGETASPRLMGDCRADARPLAVVATVPVAVPPRAGTSA